MAARRRINFRAASDTSRGPHVQWLNSSFDQRALDANWGAVYAPKNSLFGAVKGLVAVPVPAGNTSTVKWAVEQERPNDVELKELIQRAQDAGEFRLSVPGPLSLVTETSTGHDRVPLRNGEYRVLVLAEGRDDAHQRTSFLFWPDHADQPEPDIRKLTSAYGRTARETHKIRTTDQPPEPAKRAEPTETVEALLQANNSSIMLVPDDVEVKDAQERSDLFQATHLAYGDGIFGRHPNGTITIFSGASRKPVRVDVQVAKGEPADDQTNRDQDERDVKPKKRYGIFDARGDELGSVDVPDDKPGWRMRLFATQNPADKERRLGLHLWPTDGKPQPEKRRESPAGTQVTEEHRQRAQFYEFERSGREPRKHEPGYEPPRT
jgi:hypothetical protein